MAIPKSGRASHLTEVFMPEFTPEMVIYTVTSLLALFCFIAVGPVMTVAGLVLSYISAKLIEQDYNNTR